MPEKTVNTIEELIDEIENRLDKFLEDLVLQLQTEASLLIVRGDFSAYGAVGRGAKNIGFLLGSSTLDLTRHEKTLSFYAEYAPYVEYGTRPHWVPIDALLFWVRRKFGLKGKDAFKIAKAVQRKIAIKGTPPRPYLRMAMAKVFSPGNLTRTLKKYFPD